MKNGKEKTMIMVSTRPGLDSRGWFEEKSNRILEELSFLADILHRPGDAPSGGWPSKREEIDPGGQERLEDRLHIRRNRTSFHSGGH